VCDTVAGETINTDVYRVITRVTARTARDDNGDDDRHRRRAGSVRADGQDDVDMTSLTDEQQTLRDMQQIDMTDIGRQTTEHWNWRQTETSDEFKRAQWTDAGLATLWDRAQAGKTSFCICNGLLCRRANSGQDPTGDGYVLVVPAAYEGEILRCAHKTPLGGHAGIKRTLQHVESEFFFPKMRAKITQYIKHCHECQMVREIKLKDRQPLQMIQVIEHYPFQHITLDFLGGPLPTTTKGNKQVLTIVCNATGWVEAILLRNCKVQTVADVLIRFFCEKGFPNRITSDNAASFKGELMTAVWERLCRDQCD